MRTIDISTEYGKKLKNDIGRLKIKSIGKKCKNLIEKYPSMFLGKNAPQELQESFYSRTISSEFILSNPSYREYLKNVDLEVLFKFMPVNVAKEEHRYEQVNLVSSIKQIFGSDGAFDVMLLYGKYIEKVFEDNKLKNFKF